MGTPRHTVIIGSSRMAGAFPLTILRFEYMIEPDRMPVTEENVAESRRVS